MRETSKRYRFVESVGIINALKINIRGKLRCSKIFSNDSLGYLNSDE